MKVNKNKILILTSVTILSLYGTFFLPKLRGSEDKIDPNITEWGHKLKQEELDRISKLSTEKLVDVLKNGNALQAYAALEQLKKDGGWQKNFDLLLSIASERRGDMIVEGLLKPVKETSDPNGKKRVDKFLDFLELQIEKDKPSISQAQAIRSMTQTVRISGLKGWQRATIVAGIKADPNKLEIPYGNERVINILCSCLDSNDWRVRSEAILGLGGIGANDLRKADEIVEILNSQLVKEETIEDKAVNLERRKELIKYSLQRLNREIILLRKGTLPTDKFGRLKLDISNDPNNIHKKP